MIKEEYNHIIDRNLVVWGSYGKFHNEPLRKTLVKDLSDSHLMRIVVWIKDNAGFYSNNLLKLMEEEIDFRTKNYIFVPDYY